MKLRIAQPGLQGFTGQLGDVEFANGVSIDDVVEMSARGLEAIIKFERLEESAAIEEELDSALVQGLKLE